MLLAFDDTDGAAGGCTTHLAFHALLAMPELALRGMPRLVRLNPNVPWKTRGNGAVVLPLGRPAGPSVRVGELRGREVLAFPDAQRAQPSPDTLGRIWRAIKGASQADADPAVALMAEAPPATAYWQAVRSVVEVDEARKGLDAAGALHESTNDGRGLVGCLAAAAWPGPPSSFEFIAYREPARCGTPREIDSERLARLDERGVTFHSWDPEENRATCIPHGPDPVLCGLRGRDPDALREAAIETLSVAAREPVDGWLLWATNHGSGDHVTKVETLGQAPPMGTVALRATVIGEPRNQRGGHVFVAMRARDGQEFEAAAFEPTRAFRDEVRGLRPGDDVTVVGAHEAGLVKLEKLDVQSLAAIQVKLENPVCPSCGRHMKSGGIGQEFRCRHCKTTAPRLAGGYALEPRTLALGWHEVPVIARRHLHRPLAWDGT